LFARFTPLAWVAVCAAVIGANAHAAPPPEPARLRASTALLDEVVAHLLPIDVVLPGSVGAPPDAGTEGVSQAALLTELRYCGATDKGTGRFRAVVRWGSLGAATALLGGADACRQSLGELAKHAGVIAPATSDSGVAVVDLDASWRPWELKLSLVRALMPSSPSPPRPGPPRPLAPVELRRDLLTVSTAGLRIPTDTGEAITVHVAPSFAGDGIEVAATVGEGGASPPASRPAVAGGAPPVSADANLTLDLPYGTANAILRQLTASQPIVVPVEREMIELQNLSLAPAASAGSATLGGAATPRSLRETARLTVVVAGPDLKVMSLRADAQLENCAALGVLAAIACNTRNAARNSAAALATAACQKYQGSLVRELAGPQVLSVDIEKRRLELRGVLTRTAVGPRGLMVWGRLSSGAGH
jgi:hypothetical protein